MRVQPFGFAIASLVLAMSGCISAPRADLQMLPAYARSTLEDSTMRDARAQFRAIFCAQLEKSKAIAHKQQCDQWLWRLPDEQIPLSPFAAPELLDHRIRIAMVGGSFADCFPSAGLAYSELTKSLEAGGYSISTIPVAGRASAGYNAKRVRDFLQSVPSLPDQPLVLIGYSKGASDILRALVSYPEAANKVAAVLSVAGSINGSPLAGYYDSFYDRYLARMPFARCSPADGGVIDSLEERHRLAWLSRASLPKNVRYYSIATFTTPDRVARALKHFYNVLSRIDVRNDGQLLTEDELIPGSALLGYANADHWAVALRVEDTIPFFGHRSTSSGRFPQDELLLSALLYIQSDFMVGGTIAAPAAPTEPSTYKTH